jgi:hypothetical protein
MQAQQHGLDNDRLIFMDVAASRVTDKLLDTAAIGCGVPEALSRSKIEELRHNNTYLFVLVHIDGNGESERVCQRSWEWAEITRHTPGRRSEGLRIFDSFHNPKSLGTVVS